MQIPLVSECNAHGVLLHFPDYPGAYLRGATEAQALDKAAAELRRYTKWAGSDMPQAAFCIAQRVSAADTLHINDADSEILLDADRRRLPAQTFARWQALALRSAHCVERLYQSIPDKDWIQPEKNRPTFHGKTPATAREMLLHMDQVAGYYLSRIGIDADFARGRLADNRARCMELLRGHYRGDFHICAVDGELWTETKVLRRYLWHDRIHARALFRHGLKQGAVAADLDDSFYFSAD